MFNLTRRVLHKLALNGFAGAETTAGGDSPALAQQALPTAAEQVGRFLLVSVQLGLLLYAIHLFKIEENQGFYVILLPIFVGFVIHAWLPRAWRLPFFVLLTGITLFIYFDALSAAMLLGAGLLLIGIAHLPLAFSARVTLLVIAGIVLTALRTEAFATYRSVIILPILGSMFMFRLIIYMYDLRHEKQPVSWWQRLAYFFLLPNVCFPLFPVIDYKTFLRTYYDDEPLRIYQKGVDWIFRGFTHLLLYRVVYYYLSPAPASVQSFFDVVMYVASGYLLYLRVSGLFHIIAGILCLFGFNLPETHHRYFLASGFNDFWRRANIYWKDFMMKIFYYPAFFKLRRLGTLPAIGLATAFVFFSTWLLHAYQWFWIRGTFLLTLVDGLFWAIFGVLVIINSLYQAQYGKRSLARKRSRPGAALSLSLRTLGMFLFMCLLWSFWSSDSIAEWLSILAIAGRGTPGEWVVFLGALLALVVGGTVFQLLPSAWKEVLVPSRSSFRRAVLTTGGATVLLLALGHPGFRGEWPPVLKEVVQSIADNRLNARDAALFERGYYEALMGQNKFSSRMWDIQARKPPDWKSLAELGAIQYSDTLPGRTLKPNLNIVFKRARLTTNRWGMRDREYTRVKPEGVFRMALVGASYSMGSGVNDGESYESLLEAWLNRDYAGAPFSGYEILNFSVGGYTLFQKVAICRRRVFDFQPDAVLYVCNSREREKVVLDFAKLIRRDRVPRDSVLQNILQQSGATAEMPESEVMRRLQPFSDTLLAWGYRSIARLCEAHGALPVWIFLPNTGDVLTEEQVAHLMNIAQRMGFLTVNLNRVFAGYELPAVQLAPWDGHPNALGHRIIAERLYPHLVQRVVLAGR